MSEYPTITLGGFITHQEVIELAGLLALSDCYPAIMSSEGVVSHEPDPEADDHMVVEFYREAISESIRSELSFMFGFEATAEYRGSDRTFINDTLLLWGAARASRLLIRIYMPHHSITLHGCGWGGQFVRLDGDDKPVIGVPDGLFGMPRFIYETLPPTPHYVPMRIVTSFLKCVHEACLLLAMPMLPLTIKVGNSTYPMPKKQDDPRLSLVLE
jgi:hypothetical protein